MLKLKFHTYLITMQNVNTGLYRTFFLQAEAAGQFWGFVSVLPLFSLSKCEVPNFGPLYSKLGELNIQNSLACFTYNIPGTSSSNFIGFWGIDIWADFEGTRPSCTPVCSPTRFITNRTKGAALHYIDFNAGYESIAGLDRKSCFFQPFLFEGRCPGNDPTQVILYET